VRIRNLAAKAVLSPTVLVMLVCFYGCAIWTAYLSVTRSALLPSMMFPK
jgi:glucose/mannose transport system permease protein